MAGPAKQFDREEALSGAMTLFWAKGFEATSMQELVQAMGVNRASLYDTFGNKQAIYNQALDRYCSFTETHVSQMFAQTDSPLQSIQQFLMHLAGSSDGMGENGCFVNNAAVELAPHDPEIAEKVKAFWQRIEDVLTQVLDNARQQKEISVRSNSRDMACFINTVLQGMAVRSKTGVDLESARKTIELVMLALRG